MYGSRENKKHMKFSHNENVWKPSTTLEEYLGKLHTVVSKFLHSDMQEYFLLTMYRTEFTRW
jgi:hypothetical protein